MSSNPKTNITPKEILFKDLLLFDERLKNIGKEIFKLFTNNGFPPELSIEEFEKSGIVFTPEEKVSILSSYLQKMTHHKLNSGVEFLSPNHEKLWASNLNKLEQTLKDNKFYF